MLRFRWVFHYFFLFCGVVTELDHGINSIHVGLATSALARGEAGNKEQRVTPGTTAAPTPRWLNDHGYPGYGEGDQGGNSIHNGCVVGTEEADIQRW